MEIVIFIIALVLMAAGITGIFIPLLPDVPLVFGGVLFYAIFTRFQQIGWKALLIWGIITATVFVLDYLVQAMGAKKWGASKLGILGAIVGLVVGIVLGGIVGIIIGPVLGVIIFELLGDRNLKEAFKAGVGTFFGFVLGVLLKIVVGAVMVGWFLKVVLF